ncbi:MAG: S24 family peptidase [Chromatiales bacterium]|nr:S24 family peptidase [Chromatiales bacterium]MDX9766223.1 S24 family peptidase [Ectothiorhodospiraceae bacterium]
MNGQIGGCASAEPFALQVLGDSMVPEFEHGSIIIIDPTGLVESGCFVLAMHDSEYIFRQLIIQDGRHYLVALNDAYPRIEIEGVGAVAGVVVQRAGTRRSQHKHYR